MISRQSVAQQFIGNVRIDFRSAHTGMAKHLLDGEQVGTTFKQMCGKTMSESVRTDGFGNAVFLRQVLDNQEDHLSCEACASAVEENRVSEFGFWRDMQTCAFDVLEQDFQTAIANGYKSFFAAFAEDAQEAVVSVYIADLQSDEFRNTQPAAVHDLNHGLVAVAVGLAQVDAVEHLLDFLVGQHFGQVAAQSGGGDEHGWVGFGKVFLEQVTPKRLQSRKDSRLRGGTDVQIIKISEEVLDGVLLDGISFGGKVLAFKILQKQMDIVTIGFHTVVGQRKLQPQIVCEVLDEVLGNIDGLLVHGFVLQKYIFLPLW